MGAVTTAPEPAAPPLARLFAMAFRQMIDRLHHELAQRGWPDVRPPYGFVLLAARGAPLAARDVADLLGFTKQAASQLIDVMERDGYVARSQDPRDGRVKQLLITAKGRQLLATVEAIYGDIEAEWAAHIGGARVEAMRTALSDGLAGLFGDELPPVRPTW